MSNQVPRRIAARSRIRGLTLIELMIALLIGVFLLGALLTIVQTNRTVFGDQNKMAQLQDGIRMSVTMISDVIQSAGYFPAPDKYNTTADTTEAQALQAFTGYGVTFAQDQSITGLNHVTAQGDLISIRYATAPGDGIINCSGQSNSTPGALTYVNTFQVLPDANGVYWLVCTMNGTPYYLVSGVTQLTVLYGVNTSGIGNSVDTYENAASVADWSTVISTMITLQYSNPLYGSPGQPPTFTMTRVVSIMNQTGPFDAP